MSVTARAQDSGKMSRQQALTKVEELLANAEV